MQKEKQQQKTEENIKRRSLKEKDVLSAEQKKRLIELYPDINTLAELEKEREETKDETASGKDTKHDSK